MNDRALSLLGMARRANRLQIGHYAAKASIVTEKAKLCLLAQDASQRLKEEFMRLVKEKNISLIETETTMAQLSQAIGVKTAVVTITEEGFAKRIIELLQSNSEDA